MGAETETPAAAPPTAPSAGAGPSTTAGAASQPAPSESDYASMIAASIMAAETSDEGAEGAGGGDEPAADTDASTDGADGFDLSALLGSGEGPAGEAAETGEVVQGAATSPAPSGGEPAKSAAAGGGPPADERVLQNPAVREAFRQAPELRGAFFRDKAAREAGFTPEVVREMQARGVTPSQALQVLQLVPTVEDAEAASKDAVGLREMLDDFRGDPETFVARLSAIDPKAAERLLALGHREPNPQEAMAETTNRLWELLQQLQQAADAENDQDAVEDFRRVADRIFDSRGQAGRRPTPQPTLDLPPHIQAKLDAYDRLMADSARAGGDARKQFRESLKGGIGSEIERQVTTEIGRRVPGGVRSEIIEDIKKVAAEYALAAFDKSPLNVRALQEKMRGGRFDAAHLEAIVKLVGPRVAPAVVQAVTDRLEWWQKALAGGTVQAPRPNEVGKAAGVSGAAARAAAAPASGGTAVKIPPVLPQSVSYGDVLAAVLTAKSRR